MILDIGHPSISKAITQLKAEHNYHVNENITNIFQQKYHCTIHPSDIWGIVTGKQIGRAHV